ncbi:MAG: ParB/RepB/Spo0J family partition protein [Candidatus Omnitrophota bacterium]
MERRGLGKGLEALISPEAVIFEERTSENSIVVLNPEKIQPNRYQPRFEFKEDKLKELMDSIKEKGLVQPVIVRQNSADEYELIAGERRLRAIKALGRTEIPAVIKNATDLEMLEFSLIENIQRDDLNPIEEAKAYSTMINDFSFTQEQIAAAVGKNRATVANMLRLLALPEAIQNSVLKELITLGHAKAILSLHEQADQLELMDKIITEGYSVREAEQYASLDVEFIESEQQTKTKPEKDQFIRDLEEQAQRLLGTKVSIRHGAKRGKLQIEYYSLDDLNRILKIMGREESC